MLTSSPLGPASDKLKTEKTLQNDGFKSALARPLRENKKKAKKAAAGKTNGGAAEAEAK